MDVFAKIRLRQRGKKDQPPKLPCYINVVTLFFFFENAKNLGRSSRTTLNGEKKGKTEKKKGDGLNRAKITFELVGNVLKQS